MPSRYDNVRSVFEEAQRGFQHHKKLLTELKRLHDGSTQDEFRESFLWHLKHAMVVFNREPAVERVIEFVAKYATLKEHRVPQAHKVILLAAMIKIFCIQKQQDSGYFQLSLKRVFCILCMH